MTYQSNFFYNGQIRKFIGQFIRMVSNFEVEFGKDRNGTKSLQRVPVLYGDQSRQAAQIVRNNSENSLNTVPAMAVYISGLTYDRERVQNPTFISKMQLRQREFDPVTGTFLDRQGDAFTIERLMPVPYKMTLKLDVWTSNTEQKLQLWEQLTAMFNPAMEIQSNDSYIDWTSLTYVLLTDTNWDSRSVPTGGEDPISIATLTFEIPIWISTSIKLKKMGIIQAIYSKLDELTVPSSKFVNTGDYEGRTGGTANEAATIEQLGPDYFTIYDLSQFDLKIYTLLNYALLVNNINNNIILTVLKYNDTVTDDPYSAATTIGEPMRVSWADLLNEYGNFRPGITQIRLRQDNGSEIIGTITLNPNDSFQMIYTPFIDTMPSNTLDPVNAIIDPSRVDVGNMLLSPTVGTRYLLLDDVGSYSNVQGPVAWHGTDGIDLVAHRYDIIEYTGTHWAVVFDSQNFTELVYVTNLVTQIQYKWTDQQWIKSYEGRYPGGQWSIAI